MLTALGITIALLLMLDLSEKERLALIIVAISCFLTSLSFYVEILKKSKSDKR
jgi:hypothetical protein